jgi:uncharacterized protein (TIGR00369 family)
MPRFEPKNPDFRAAAIATFERQRAMQTLGISIASLGPGEVELAMAYSPALVQQNGFLHAGIITAGLDTACGIAAFTLMPAGADILTVEFKTNLLAPAGGERFIFRAAVVKPGRTLTVCEARAYALRDATERLVATLTGTLMAMVPNGEAVAVQAAGAAWRLTGVRARPLDAGHSRADGRRSQCGRRVDPADAGRAGGVRLRRDRHEPQRAVDVVPGASGGQAFGALTGIVASGICRCK